MGTEWRTARSTAVRYASSGRDVAVQSFANAGWPIPSPEATMFIWSPIPEKFAHLGSVEFSKLLIERAHVAVAPGLGFGEHGDGHVRIALVENEQRIRQAARNIRRFLKDATGDERPEGIGPREALARAG